MYNLNGKVKHLVQEFSKSSQSLPSSIPKPERSLKSSRHTTLSEPIATTRLPPGNNGGGAAGNGILEEHDDAGQISRQGGGAGHVRSFQRKDTVQQQEPKQQYQKETAVEVAQVGKTREHKPIRQGHRHRKFAREHRRAGQGIDGASSGTHMLRERPSTQERSPPVPSTPTRWEMIPSIDNASDVSRNSRRLGDVDSVVMSARNTLQRKSKSGGLASGDTERYGLSLELGIVEELSVPRVLNKSTAPSPLTIVKAKTSKVESGSGIKPFDYAFQTPAIPTRPHLAPPAQRYVEPQEHPRASETTPTSDSMSIRTIHRRSRRKSSGSLSKRSCEEGLDNPPPSPALVRERASMEGRGQYLRTKRSQLPVPQTRVIPRERPYGSLPRPNAPRMKIYDDNDWRGGSRNVLQSGMEHGDESAHPYSLMNTLDGFSMSQASWSTPSLSMKSPPFDDLPLSPPCGQFRNYILSPGDTAGQYHSLSERKIEQIRQLPHASFAEQVRLQHYNPRFSTFHKQESLSDTAPMTPGQEHHSVGSPVETKTSRKSGPGPRSPVQRSGREGVGKSIMSPSYLSELSRVMIRAGSVDIENKRYSLRQRQ